MAEEWTTKKVDKYVLVNKVLGSGAYGTVYRGFLQSDESRQVAVKTIPIKVISETPKMLELIKREIAILQKITHPNIVTLLDVARTSNYLYMFLEYCQDGDLKEYLHKKGRLSELEAVVFLKHIVEGFKRLYKQKIIHRDIKPANILLHNGVAKITDFGFARVIETEMNDPAYLSRLGSPLYMAPQILEGQPFSAKCDVWSVGVMFYELLYGRTPWIGDNAFNLLENIKKQPLKFPPKPVRSQKVKELITLMLKVNEKERITWEGVFDDPTIKIEEKKIRENMEQIMKNKDEISKSISLNKLYIDQNLVVGYLANNPLNTLESSDDSSGGSTNQQSQQDFVQFSSKTDTEINEQQIMNNYKNEKKKRDTIMKYNQYLLFERNVSFFFNFMIQKLVSLNQMGAIPLNPEAYFRLIYVIAKNQMIHLERLNYQIHLKEHPKFDRDLWGKFQVSQEYEKLIKLLKSDISNSLEFYHEIQRKCQDACAQSEDVKKFLEVLNNQFEANEAFHSVYADTIRDLMTQLMPNAKLRVIGLCLYYLRICLNPYEEFQDINCDFNKFYEDSESATDEEIQQKVAKIKN